MCLELPHVGSGVPAEDDSVVQRVVQLVVVQEVGVVADGVEGIPARHPDPVAGVAKVNQVGPEVTERGGTHGVLRPLWNVVGNVKTISTLSNQIRLTHLGHPGLQESKLVLSGNLDKMSVLCAAELVSLVPVISAKKKYR